jgi:hypothetical protein
MGNGRHVGLRDPALDTDAVSRVDASRKRRCQGLAERIRAIERRGDAAAGQDRLDSPARECIPTGWADVDAALGGGLAAGGLHEWFGVEETVLKQGIKGLRDLGIKGRGRSTSIPRSSAPSSRQWAPPLCILVHLAWQASRNDLAPRWTVWVGRRCHPYPRVLIRGRGEDRRLLERSLFVAPRDAAARLWAVELALRSPAVGSVIADGSGFDRAATQRIQLLARTQNKWVLAACPTRQQHELSAAQTRWRVRGEGLRDLGIKGLRKEAASSQSLNPLIPYSLIPRWSVELLRCKGMRPAAGHPGAPGWLLEWNRDEGAVGLSAGLGDLAGAPEKRASRAATARIQQRTA